MTAPHEIATPGPAADVAAALRARLPVIETERLRLRAPVIEDFPVYAEITTGPRGIHVLEAPDREAAWLDFTQMIATWLLRGHGLWTVEDHAGEVQGFVLIGFEPGDHEPELGFLVRERAEGKGIAAEAATAARQWAYDTAGLATIVSTVDHGNARSCALAERLGATRDPAAETAHDNAIRVYRHPGPEALQ